MNNIEKIEQYLRGELSGDALTTFENQLTTDALLQKEIADYEEIFEALKLEQDSAFVAKQLVLAREQEDRTTQHLYTSLRSYASKYWQTAAIAASVAFLASTMTFYVAKKSFIKENDSRIIQLVNKDLRAIKKQQVDIRKDLNEVKTNVAPDYPSNYTGTGFALTNDGYAITNLHVIAGGTKVFLFTKDGKTYKCNVVLKDEVNDIAVLKVVNDSVTFSANALPYRLTNSAQLAEKVFSLGYPKDEVVYNEGYVSSMNGKDGDSTKYQLELPSNPGVSGAPVMNEAGNIIGIINSKESQSKGITYAIKTGVLQHLLDSVQSTNPISLPKNTASNRGNRSAQIKKIQDFIFLVKVYN